MAKRPVTVNDLLAGQVGLDIECADRVYLNGYVPNLQQPGQIVGFLTRHLGQPIPSPALMDQIGQRFRHAVDTYTEANRIPVVRFGKGQRKVDVMRPLMRQAAATGRSQVVAVGIAQEYALVTDARTTRSESGAPWFTFAKAQRRVNSYYFYLWDTQMGGAFIKVCSYFPYPMKIWVNGHEWAKRHATAAGVGFTELSNGFASCADAAGLQAICDRFGPEPIRDFIDRWLDRLPLPLTAADKAAGYWWDISMRQVEFSRTIVFTQPRHARTFFETLVADNLDLGRPDQIEIIFGRGIARRRRTTNRSARTRPGPEVFKTAIDRANQGVTVNVFFKHSRAKQYLKDGRAMRIETVVNDTTDLGVLRRLEHFDELSAKARAINHRIVEAERVGQGAVLASPAFERIAHPSVEDGRMAPALRFGDPRVQALAGALAHTLTAATGITNRSLRALMPALLGGSTYTASQASYDLTRLRLKGLIERLPGRNVYHLTPAGQRFAVFYTKLHNRLLRPLLAADAPPAPLQLRQALRTIDRHIDDYLDLAGVCPD
ncbi:hypothetical protein [Micromonospora fulviviridis]|uniref:MarR family transcriptional regulator n=1 Tax=Micromonospora fulviviridis TaxID=47860 RepID=A0ABV2VW63_9ACTN